MEVTDDFQMLVKKSRVELDFRENGGVRLEQDSGICVVGGVDFLDRSCWFVMFEVLLLLMVVVLGCSHEFF